MKTYRATEVRLLTPIGNSATERTIKACDCDKLLVAPEHRQAVISRGGKDMLSLYEWCVLDVSELDRVLEVYVCAECGALFENAQGLGQHRGSGRCLVQNRGKK